MQNYKADLHIHTVLSPCGDLDMSPGRIVEEAKKKKIQILGITDHNTTRQCKVVKQMAAEENIFVMCGAEITTREEAHCLAFFENDEKLEVFQTYLDAHLPDIKNNPSYFGYQVAVDQNEEIIFQEERLLISALDQGINEIEKQVHALGGIFIPAHVDKPKFSLMSQLGFIPTDLQYDALELSKFTSKEVFLLQNKYLGNPAIIRNSDAHVPHLIGDAFTIFQLAELSFAELLKALHNKEGREIVAI
ncbi:MAG: PHP domain-containing protein [Lentimicrobiaceae bacterium]|nr:PHP domain-containing protein [Lentimicrobiaceae bacterium]